MKKLTFHHSALSRGYIRVGETKEETYKGRFGTGKRFTSTTHSAVAIASSNIGWR